MDREYIAVDIGGSSVKLIIAKLNKQKIEIIEEQNFANRPLSLSSNLYIDIYMLYTTIKNAIAQLCVKGHKPVSLGIDTYGNGYGILDRDKSMIGLPFFYKDPRVNGILDKLKQHISPWDLYQQTGVFPTDIRVLMQLYYEVITNSTSMEHGKHLLLLPDLFAYLFTGELYAERSMASVANLLDLNGEWCFNTMSHLSIPADIFPKLIDGGNNARFHIIPQVSDEMCSGDMRFTYVTSHDTESALLAAPMLSQGVLFVSLGTSIIFGTPTKSPIISYEGYLGKFKNVRSAFNSNSFCRDFNGLWLLEQCMELWRRKNPVLTYDDVIQACELEEENDTYIDVCDSDLYFYSGTIPEVINNYCERTGQKKVYSIGSIAKCILESVALEIKWSYEKIKSLLPDTNYNAISAVGGGIHNKLLIQHISDAISLPLYTGSKYSASMGNILMQMYSCEELGSIEEIKEVARSSCDMSIITPRNREEKWEKALERLKIYKNINKKEGVKENYEQEN